MQHGGGVSAQSLHSVPEPPQATAPAVNQPQHGPGYILNLPKIYQYLSGEPIFRGPNIQGKHYPGDLIPREINIEGNQYPGEPISRGSNIHGNQYREEPISRGTNTKENQLTSREPMIWIINQFSMSMKQMSRELISGEPLSRESLFY